MQPLEERDMDDFRFDELTKRLGGSRRRFLKQVAGLGGAAAVSHLATGDAEAARRGYSGPISSPPPGITIDFIPAPQGACTPRANLTGFPPNADLTVTWYVNVGRTPNGPYFSQASTDANGSAESLFPEGVLPPRPDLFVTAEVSGFTAGTPVVCPS
jgi:hypothetical protein